MNRHGLLLLMVLMLPFSSRAEPTTGPVGPPPEGMPRIIQVSPDSLPKARLIGTPEVRTLLGYTRRLLHLQDGHTFAVFSYGAAPGSNALFLVDGNDGTSRTFPIPSNHHASHGSDLGHDGHIYTMPYGNSRVYRFDTKALAFETIPVDVPAQELTWEAFCASNGRIYFGTYPGACLGEFDPATRQCTLWPQAAPNTKYVTDFGQLDASRVRFRAWGPDQVWMAFDPATRRLEKLEGPPPRPTSPPPSLPAPPEGDQRFSGSVTVEGRTFTVSFPSGRFWEAHPGGELRLLGDTHEPAAPSWWLESVPGAVVGISYFGMTFRYDLKTGEFRHRELDNKVPGGNDLMFIEAVTPRCVIGAHYSQQNLFTIDPQTGRIDAAEGMIASVTGEPMCAVGFEGRAYLGIYVNSILSRYDPGQPFTFGKNPKELIDLSAQYAQTRPRAAVTDGQLVFISSDSAYNKLGGALAVIDPNTQHIDVYHHLIRDQNLPTLAYDPATKLLWGGSNRWGQMKSHPPTQESSLLYAFDPDSRQVVARQVLWPGSDETSVLAVADRGILLASSGPEAVLFDTRSRTILARGPWPVEIPRRARRGGDGHVYFLSGGLLYRWNASARTLTPLAQAPECNHLTELALGRWAVASTTSIFQVDLPPE